jgi:cytochrome P450
MRPMDTFIEPLVKQLVEHPSNDLVSLVANAGREGVFDYEQVLQNLAFFVIAGHETTINLIHNGLLAFIRNPEQRDLLRSDPEKFASGATEECLRYDPPAPSLERIAAEDIELTRSPNRTSPSATGSMSASVPTSPASKARRSSLL